MSLPVSTALFSQRRAVGDRHFVMHRFSRGLPMGASLSSRRAVTSLIALAVTVSLGGCAVVRQDDARLTGTSSSRLENEWGCSFSAGGTRGQTRCFKACAAASRVKTLSTTIPTYGRIAYRRLTVFDGDDMGAPGTERCELGRNESRHGEANYNGTFKLYREGDHFTTWWLQRLPSNLDIKRPNWQVVMQMLQTQPTDSATGGPMIELDADSGRWVVRSNWKVVWSTPARSGVWTAIAFDVQYSRDPSKGRLRVGIDGNGDGRLSAGESSPTLRMATLRRSPSSGASVPSHLRLGLYHDAAYSCPPPAGCSSEFADVRVYKP